MKKSFISLILLLALGVQAFPNDNSTDPSMYFLNAGDVLDSENFLEAPPVRNSAHYTYDFEQYMLGKKQRDTPRGKQAVLDADLSDGWLDRSFSEAFGFVLTPQGAPEIYALISNMKEDAGDLATRSAKDHYKRPRPFMVFNEPSATPEDEPALRENGSYPSGHTSIGWATALVLSEINPARIQEIMKRGYDFGQSRVICGAHFQSDVDAGRLVGAAVVSRLHADKNFQKQLAKAKKEFVKLQKEKEKKAKVKKSK